MKYNTAFLQQLQHELDNGTLPSELGRRHSIDSSVLSRLKKHGKLNFVNERPQKRDWVAFEQSFHEHGLERAIAIHNTTILTVRKAIEKGRLSNVLNITPRTNVNTFRHYTKEELTQAILSSTTIAEVCRKLGVTICTYNYNRIKLLCKEYKIICEFPTERNLIDNKSYGHTFEDIFCENSMISRSRLRPALIRFDLYTGECAICKCSDIHNKCPLTLEVDHINGICDDNRIENLRWLCPNCHSQTSTYRRRRNLR